MLRIDKNSCYKRIKTGLIVTLCMAISTVLGQTENSPSNFINQFKNIEGQYFEGKILQGGREGDGFVGNKLIMHVAKVADAELRIPFFVGENKSRTWIITKNENGTLKLKHDHRHEDGSPEDVTFYGGDASNFGWDNLQMFPADDETCRMIDYACHNVWWIMIDGNTFTYNLRRIGSERVFTVSFDLSESIRSDLKPW